jgi:hypothetical protein
VRLTNEAAAAEPDYARFAVWRYGALLARGVHTLEYGPPRRPSPAEDFRLAAKVMEALLPGARPEARPTLESWAARARELVRAAETRDPEERRRILAPVEAPAPGGK